MNSILAPGKLPAPLLSDLLQRLAPADPRVIVGPGIGHDAAVIEFGDRYLVAKTDPITFATDEIGWYAVQVNANDVACLGATPRWFLATLLLPAGQTDQALVERIAAQLYSACQSLGISLVGGHTEITNNLDRPVICGTMLAEVQANQLIRPGGAQPGDRIVLTKGFPIEGTAILAREKAEELRQELPADGLRRCQNFLHDPGISVVRDAQIAGEVDGVHAMHDPTEGGLATGLWELAESARVQIIVERNALPILPEGEWLCRRYGLDPLGAIASGCLLIAVAPTQAEPLCRALGTARIPATIVGEVRPGNPNVNLPRFDQDELIRVLS